jgi:hypothetical protein
LALVANIANPIYRELLSKKDIMTQVATLPTDSQKINHFWPNTVEVGSIGFFSPTLVRPNQG